VGERIPAKAAIAATAEGLNSEGMGRPTALNPIIPKREIIAEAPMEIIIILKDKVSIIAI
jgi:hypothetical protein